MGNLIIMMFVFSPEQPWNGKNESKPSNGSIANSGERYDVSFHHSIIIFVRLGRTD